MAKLSALIRLTVGALALAFVLAIAAPAPVSAQGNQGAVTEQQLLQQLKTIQGRVSIPDRKSATLEQPAGRDWRHFHQVTLHWIGGIAIIGVLAILVIFYLTRGMIRIEGGRSGRTIIRFTALERFVHWMTAACFIILALSGLNITFGRALLLPIIVPSAFTAWS